MRLRRFRRSQDTFSKRQGAREWAGHASALVVQRGFSLSRLLLVLLPLNAILRVRMDTFVGRSSRVYDASKQLASPMIDNTAYASANCGMPVELLLIQHTM